MRTMSIHRRTRRATAIGVLVFILLTWTLISYGHKSPDPMPVTSPTPVESQAANLHIPFIVNEGQVDSRVTHYARTFGGTVFITDQGDIVYALPAVEGQDISGEVVLIERAVGGSIECIQGEDPVETCVSSFRGNDPGNWYSGIAAYEWIHLGEVYAGIEMRLRAYSSTIEKLFYVEPGADPRHSSRTHFTAHQPKCRSPEAAQQLQPSCGRR